MTKLQSLLALGLSLIALWLTVKSSLIKTNDAIQNVKKTYNDFKK